MTAVNAVPPRVRRAAVDILQPYGIGAEDLVADLGRARGFRSVSDLVDAAREGYGEAAGHAISQAVALQRQRTTTISTDDLFSATLRQLSKGKEHAQMSSALTYSDAVLVSVPDEWFVEAIAVGAGGAVDAAPNERAGQTFDAITTSISRLFERSGVPYQFGEGTELERVGDPVVAAASVQPALSRLDDNRLAVARRHFHEALAAFRNDAPRLAVDEARHAVEAGLLAYIDGCGGQRPSKHQGDPLFNAAVEAGLPKDARELVLGAVRLRGRTTAGHPGKREPTMIDAEAAIAAAGASLIYLAGHLP